jgi:hypothetical protein
MLKINLFFYIYHFQRSYKTPFEASEISYTIFLLYFILSSKTKYICIIIIGMEPINVTTASN